MHHPLTICIGKRRKSVLLGLGNMDDDNDENGSENRRNSSRRGSARRKSIFADDDDDDQPTGMSLLNHRAKSASVNIKRRGKVI